MVSGHFDGRVFCKSADGGVARLVVLDHIHRCFERKFVCGRGERRAVFAPYEDAGVEELIVSQLEVVKEITLGRECKGRRRRCKIYTCDELVYARIEKCVRRSEYCMNV